MSDDLTRLTADETVRVPAALVRELSAETHDYPAGMPETPLLHAARALVDAAERPRPKSQHQFWGSTPSGECYCDDCEAPDPDEPPAPLSSPRRTRDEGTEDEAEAWAVWVQESRDQNYTVRDVFIAGFRAARLAGEDDPIEIPCASCNDDPNIDCPVGCGRA